MLEFDFPLVKNFVTQCNSKFLSKNRRILYSLEY